MRPFSDSFYVSGPNALNFGANDAVVALTLQSGATATTAATGNVTGSISMTLGSVLHLGADLNLTTSLTVFDPGTTLDAHHFGITTGALFLGSTSPGALVNAGAVQVGELSVDNGSTLTLHGGDVVNGEMFLTGASVLTVQQTSGMGLTYNGGPSFINPSNPAQLDLVFTSTGWDFRWLDPSNGGNWISTIDDLITAGDITISLPAGFSYEVADQGGYTYINGITGASVPEPSSLVLAAMATAGVAVGWRWRRSRPRR